MGCREPKFQPLGLQVKLSKFCTVSNQQIVPWIPAAGSTWVAAVEQSDWRQLEVQQGTVKQHAANRITACSEAAAPVEQQQHWQSCIGHFLLC